MKKPADTTAAPTGRTTSAEAQAFFSVVDPDPEPVTADEAARHAADRAARQVARTAERSETAADARRVVVALETESEAVRQRRGRTLADDYLDGLRRLQAMRRGFVTTWRTVAERTASRLRARACERRSRARGAGRPAARRAATVRGDGGDDPGLDDEPPDARPCRAPRRCRAPPGLFPAVLTAALFGAATHDASTPAVGGRRDQQEFS